MKPLLLVLVLLFVAPASAATDPVTAPRPEGAWQGAIELPTGNLRVAVHISRDANDALIASFDSIDQGQRGMKIDAVSLAGRTLTFQMNAIRAQFKGDFDASGEVIAGSWTQATVSLPLTLRRDANLPTLRRPQLPARPLPYREEEVAYDSAPGVRLAATLTLPEGKGPFPAVVLITGSGAQDRDEAIAGHRPFYILADALTRRGIAVLRADDRGTGSSTGSFAAAITPDFAVDALAGIRFLLQRPEIDARRIGFIGHSEGAVVAPLAATGNDTNAGKVAFLVLLAPPAVPLGQILEAQQQLILRAAGMPEAAIAGNVAVSVQLIGIARTNSDPAAAAEQMRTVLRGIVAQMPEAQRAQAAAQMEPQIAQLGSPWMRWMLRHDPAPALRQVKVPMLALFGGKDLQVPPAQNLMVMKAAVEAAGNPGSEVQEFAGLNHLFQTATTGGVGEYAQIEETMSPAVLKKIGDWVLQQGISARR